MKKKSILIHILAALAALGAATPPFLAIAQTNQWQGGTSDWSVDGNWSLGTVPDDGEDVEVTDALGGVSTVDFFGVGTPTYASLLIDGVTVTHVDSATMSTDALIVGGTGFATLSLGSGAVLNVTNNAVFGSASGSAGYGNQVDSSTVAIGGDLILADLTTNSYAEYSLESGTLDVTGQTIVGASGEAIFTQNGGTHTTGALVLGRDDDGYGTYHLNAGVLNDSAIIGDAGVGVFNNNGATHNVSGDLILGNQATGDGTYNLDLDGTVTVTGDTIVGNFRVGVFSHIDGDHSTTNLVLGSESGSMGRYTLESGMLTVTGDTIVGNYGDGLFNHFNGTHETTNLIIGNHLGTSSNYTIQAGTLTVNGDLLIGQGQSGEPEGAAYFALLGGQVDVSGGFYQNAGYDPFTANMNGQVSTFELSAGTLNSGGFGSMSNNSEFLHNGGEHNNSGLFIIGNSGGSDYDTAYSISGATAVANFNDLWVGGFGRGVLNQSDGEVNVAGEMRVGDGPDIDPAKRYGIVNMTGGALTASNNVIVGAGNDFFAGEPGGRGTFNQDDGDVMISGALILGQTGLIGSGHGTYNITAGTLTTADLVVGQQGTFNQAKGFVNQSGGDVVVTGFMTLGEGNDGDGKYELSGGTLSTGNAIVGGDGTGFFHQTGGTYETVFLNVGGGGFALTGNGEVRIDAGSMTIDGNLVLGNDIGGNGTFNQVGGSVAVNDPTFGVFINNGLYSMGGGTLDVVANMIVGDKATGSFNQTAGTVDVGDRVTLGSIAGVTGNMTLTGGTTTVGSMRVGDEGKGVLNVLGAGQLLVTNDPGNLSTISVAHAAGSTGKVNVGGSGALTASNRLTVGLGGDATFTQGDSSTVTVGGLRIANLSGSTSSYTLNGGTLDVLSTEGVNGGSRIGISGTGTFTHNGGTHNTTFMQIGGATFGQGSGGTGTYNLNGGSLVSSGTISIRPNADGASGTLNIAGGSLSAPLIVNNDQLNYSGGSIAANVTNNKDFNVSGGAARTLTGSLTNNTGGTTTVAVNTPFSITGALHQAGGSISADSNITVGTDYTNTGFGSGNGFDRRAGVTGNGAIHGLNASQTITAPANPALLTNTGANAFTLDFGIVRGGGSRTVSYQVKNDGTGADIRGAIQTAANGGSITDGRLSGSGVTAGNFGPIAAGGNTGNLSVTFNATSGGALTGQTVAVHSNFENVATQVVTITGAATTLATGVATPNSDPVNLGNFRVGGAAPSQAFQVDNQASGPNAEQLGIGGVSTSGNFVASNNLGSGFIDPAGSLANAVTASVSGGTAGVNSGSLTIQYTTNGQLIDSTFTTINSNSQSINLQATGYNKAAGAASPDPIVIANQRVGGSLTQALTIENTAPVSAFTEKLNASFGANGGQATNNGGAVSLLAAGTTNSTSMMAGVDTSSAGAKAGTVTVNFETDGTGTSGLAAASVGSQTIQVTGNVYNAAAGSATPSPTVNLGNVRVGGTLAQTFTVSNTAPAGAFSEDLNASFGASTGDASNNGGSISGLLAGSNNGAAMSGSLNTASSGAKTGTVTINYETAGTVNGVSNTLGTASVGSETITLNGNVYQAAAGQIQTPALNFNVQVGQPVAQDLVIRNTATGAAGFVEDLNASFGTAGDARISGSGTLAGILAGTNSTAANGTMTVNVDTSSAGNINSSIQVLYETAGKVAGVSNGLGTASAGFEDYVVSGSIQVNVIDQAKPVINGIANPGAVTVDFGNVRINTATGSTLTVLNQATGNQQADLNASIASNGAPVTASGSFTGLAPGATNPLSGTGTSLQVGVDTSVAGVRSGSATVSLVSDITSFGNCAPNCTLNLPNQTVNVSANVFQIAQPDVPANVDLGSFRLGSAPSQAITIGNTDVSPAGFQEGLDASIGGTAGKATASGGPTTNLAAGGTSNAITVGINNGTATAGANAGTVTLNLATNGSGTSGLGTMALADAVINVSATGWNIATGSASPSPTMTLGNFRVGGAGAAAPQDQNLTVSNTAPNDGFSEKVGISSATVDNAAFTLTNNLGAGLVATGSPAAAALNIARTGGGTGLISGTIAIQYTSDGTGTSELAAIASNNQNITVEATGYLVAQPSLPSTVNLGNVRLGAASQAITISNTDIAGSFQEGLNASTGTTTGQATASGGPIVNLAPGAGSSAISVGLAGIVAGTGNTGTVQIALASNGTASGLSDLPLPDQIVTVNATGYRLANPTINNSPITIAARVGDAVAANKGVSITNASPDAFTEGLKVTITGASGNAQSNGGAITNLAAQGTNSSAIMAGLLSTATAGMTAGQIDLKFVSTGAGTTDAPDLDIGTGTVAVNGKVYTAAVGALDASQSTNLNFGTVRVGTNVADTFKNVTVKNTASVTALNDTLTATLTTGDAPFQAFSTVSGIGAGQTNAPGTLKLGMNTGTAGNFSGSATVDFLSVNPDMDDLALASSGPILLSGTVNAIANPVFGKTGGFGLFSCLNQFTCTLDFGNLFVGSGQTMGTLALTNLIGGPADDLLGSFDLAGLGSFLGAGFGAVDLAFGESLLGLNLSFDALTEGLFNGSFLFSGRSHNAFQDDLALADITVFLRANVIRQGGGGTVPEPGTITIVLLGAGLAFAARRRSRRE